MVGSDNATGATASAPTWHFQDAEFSLGRWQLRVNGRVVNAERKPLEVLALLLRHAGEVVAREDFFDELWRGRVVVDNSLTNAVAKLRRLLGDTDGTTIVTVSTIGYRLDAPVRWSLPVPAGAAHAVLVAGGPVPRRSGWRLSRRLDASDRVQVWLASNDQTGEPRVFKFAPDEAALGHLRRELTLSRLLRESLGQRDDFVKLLGADLGTAPYFLEFAYAGQDLLAWSRASAKWQASTLEARVALFARICSSVAAAHEAGVLHKDLKPANVLVEERDDQVLLRIADFGSSRLMQPEKLAQYSITALGLTREGEKFPGEGTPLYLAPELLLGQMPDVRSDVYSLGVMLYQFAVGDLARPLAQGWESGVADELVVDDIAAAVHGAPELRTPSATMLAASLARLPQRRKDHELAREKARRDARADAMRLAWRARLPWVAATLSLLLAAIVASTYLGVERDRASAVVTPAADAEPALPGSALPAGSSPLLAFLTTKAASLDDVRSAPENAWHPYEPADPALKPEAGEVLWLRIFGRDALTLPPGWIATVANTGYGEQRLHSVLLSAPISLRRNMPARDGWSPRALVFDLPAGLDAASPAFLELHPRARRVPEVQVRTAKDYFAEDARAGRLIAAALAALACNLFVVLAFVTVIRDPAFMHYAAYLASVLGFVLYDTDFAYLLPGFSALAGLGQHASWIFAILASAFMISFAGAFVSLPRHAPRLWRAANWVRWILFLMVPPLLLPREAPLSWYPIPVNLLLLTGFALVFTGSVRALPSGNPYAKYFLLGWVPLIALAGIRTAMALGLLEFHQAYETLLQVGILWESGVLLVALAWRAARGRQDGTLSAAPV